MLNGKTLLVRSSVRFRNSMAKRQPPLPTWRPTTIFVCACGPAGTPRYGPYGVPWWMNFTPRIIWCLVLSPNTTVPFLVLIHRVHSPTPTFRPAAVVPQRIFLPWFGGATSRRMAREPNKPPTGIAYGIWRWVGAPSLMPSPHPAHRHQLCGALLFCVRVQPGRPALGRGHIECLGGGTLLYACGGTFC